MIKSSNPALSGDAFTGLSYSAKRSEAMTIQGTVGKALLLLLLAMLSAGWIWTKFYQSGQNASAVSTWMMVGAIGGFIVALATVFKKEWSAITAPLYAVLEGLFIGGLSAALESAYPGIIIQAAGLTFGTLFAMLLIYQSGLIKATENFKLGVFAATGGIAIFYLIMMVLGFFGIQPAFMYGNSWLSIGISLFVVGIAALNFIIDFDIIERGANASMPKYMEWYGAFALMVTLIWLYIEFIRLLSKLRSR